jgi:pyrroline-5-carboxylate reductase
MTKQSVLSFIGTGHLGSALVKGFVKSGYPAEHIVVSNRSPEKSALLVNTLGVSSVVTNTQAAEVADVIFLAVKPQFIEEVCLEISPVIIKKRPLIISLAGVISLHDLSLALGDDTLGIVRAMTNTPTEYRKGISALFASVSITTAQRKQTAMLFNLIGKSIWVEKEGLLNTLTAPVGCAPAYVFLFLEALEEAAISVGISPDLAKDITLNAVIGAAELATQSGESFSSLREKVTTKGGITAASLEEISMPDFISKFKQVYKTAEKRIHEIDITLRKK